MHIEFASKRVLVTGGTKGLGHGAVKAFLEAGDQVAVNGRSGESVANAISDPGHRDKLVAAPGDISTVSGCSSKVSSAISSSTGFDILVNSAGVAAYGVMEQVDESKNQSRTGKIRLDFHTLPKQ